MDPDPEVPKTSGGSGSATLVFSYGSGSTPPTSGSGSRRFKRYESDGSGSKGLFTYSDPGEQIQYGSYRVRIQNNKKEAVGSVADPWHVGVDLDQVIHASDASD